MKTSRVRRFRGRQLILQMALSAAVGACTSPLTPLPTSRPLGRDLGSLSPTALDLSRSRQPFEEPEGPLTLPLALAAALKNSPALESFAWQVRADEARTLQAGLLPNPFLRVEAENFGGSGDVSDYDAAETTVFLGQLVELGGKRAKRRRIAMLDRELSGWDYEAARLDVLTETTQRFVAVLAAAARLELAGDLLRVATESLTATRARIRAGAASPVEEARSKVALATLEIELARRRVELDAAMRQLAASWGSTSPRFDYVSGELAEVRELPSLEQISAALSENPDLARWSTEIARREASFDLARAGAIPDFVTGVGVRQFEESDDTALVVGIEIPLPLFDRQQGSRDAALAESGRARALSRVRRLEANRALIAAHADAFSAFESARSLERDVLPQADAAYETTEAGYRKGLFPLVDVLDAQQLLFEAKSEYVNALERYHAAAAELERLAGASLDSISETSH